MDNIKVAIWGFGAMGSGIAKVLLNKRGVDITGVCDIHPERVGKSIFNVLGMERAKKGCSDHAQHRGRGKRKELRYMRHRYRFIY